MATTMSIVLDVGATVKDALDAVGIHPSTVIVSHKDVVFASHDDFEWRCRT